MMPSPSSCVKAVSGSIEEISTSALMDPEMDVIVENPGRDCCLPPRGRGELICAHPSPLGIRSPISKQVVAPEQGRFCWIEKAKVTKPERTWLHPHWKTQQISYVLPTSTLNLTQR